MLLLMSNKTNMRLLPAKFNQSFNVKNSSWRRGKMCSYILGFLTENCVTSQ